VEDVLVLYNYNLHEEKYKGKSNSCH